MSDLQHKQTQDSEHTVATFLTDEELQLVAGGSNPLYEGSNPLYEG